MSVLVLVIIGIALNLVPAKVDEFSLKMENAPKMVLQKQADGGWAIKGTPLKFQADNTDLIMIIKGAKRKIDLSAVAGLDKDVVWKELKQVIVGDIPAEIRHLENGFEVIQKKKKGGKVVERRWEVSWAKEKNKK